MVDSGEIHVSFQFPVTRLSILGSYWIVILLALPLWWSTTSIQRLSLPASQVHALSSEKLRFPIHVQLDTSNIGVNATWLAREVQWLANARLKDELDVHVIAAQEETTLASESYLIKIDPEAQGFAIRDRQLICNRDALSPSKLANTLTAILAPYTNHGVQSHLVAKYSPRYRLAFSLLNEDAAQGQAAIGWDIKEAISQYLLPTLESLSVLHNFTIESQVQFHAPLAFTPRTMEAAGGISYGLTAEDLTVFVNSAEWTLSSSASNDPVLHFILFIPSAARRPLRVLDNSGHPSTSSAFILPQWGGIVIYNPDSDGLSHTHMTPSRLNHSLSTFRYQLSVLLGIPQLPFGIASGPSSSPVSFWQLDALLRNRALENIQGSVDTLQSIIKLVDQIKNMPVKEDVRGDIQDALAAVDMTYDMAPKSAALALLHSSRALTLSSRAFFNPGMLALLYFPPEHTYAVYAPLFAPISLPLITPVIRELLARWKASRTAKEKKEKLTRQKAE